ncbi:hypothetical protein RB595_010372 [Gaeumannomyces hyphopodioides]
MASTLPAYHTSMLTAVDCRGHVHLVLGTNPLAASRCAQSLAVGAKPILIAPDANSDAGDPLHYALRRRVDSGEVQWLRRPFSPADVSTLGRPEASSHVDAVFVTAGPRDPQSEAVSALCRRLRVPVNVVDAPRLCTFSLLSTHTDGPLQVGVTTNGRGCRLAGRLRRELAASLPAGMGSACARLGELRRRIQEEDGDVVGRSPKRQKRMEEKEEENKKTDDDQAPPAAEDEDESYDQRATFNKLVTDTDLEVAKTRRMRWLAQVCEYWPLKRLAAVDDADVDAVLEAYTESEQHDRTKSQSTNQPNPSPSPFPATRGRVILAGSGPGHPDLLTRATYKALQAADVVLADKLVPAGVLDLIPRRTPVTIARKFPGNADAAQDELMAQAVAAARAGKVVLRLKQGDPYVYGRGGEEVATLRAAGLAAAQVAVLPGVTSALSAPLFAGVPPTQRDVADQVLICTGTGKKGRPPAPPEFVASRTVVFLMALHRIVGLVRELTGRTEEEEEKQAGGSEQASKPPPPARALWPKNTPCAVVERASCPDQRVIRTTLEFVAEAIEQEGSRPPGLLVVGRACEVLHAPEKGRSWTVEDGFKGLDLDELVPQGAGLLA